MLKNKKTLISLIIILIIIIAGIVMILVKGINYGLSYGDNTTVELYLQTDFEEADIYNIITEVFGNNIRTKQVNNLSYDILIITKSASDEQLENLVSRINEKYDLELGTDDLLVTNNVEISLIDLISPYILPVCIALILILIYFIIKYKKLGIYRVSLFTLLTVIILQLLYINIYAITRLPICEFTMPISMIIYLISVIALTEKFENDLQKLKKEQN